MKLIYIKHGRQFLIISLVLVIVMMLAVVSMVKDHLGRAQETLLPIYGTDDDNMRISLTLTVPGVLMTYLRYLIFWTGNR